MCYFKTTALPPIIYMVQTNKTITVKWDTFTAFVHNFCIIITTVIKEHIQDNVDMTYCTPTNCMVVAGM